MPLRLALLLLAAWQAAAPAAGRPAAPRSVLPLPGWAMGRDNKMFWREFNRDVAAIQAHDVAARRMDVALYGDSIAAWNKPLNLTKVPGTRAVWNSHFGDLAAEPLGIPGDRIATVLWRLAVGEERPSLADPRVVILWIGINDIIHKTPDIAGKMDFLVKWVRTEMPATAVVVQALLPSLSPAVAVNAAFKKIAAKYGATYSACGQDIIKNDRRHMADLLHPNAAGQDKVLGCLRDLVEPMLRA